MGVHWSGCCSRFLERGDRLADVRPVNQKKYGVSPYRFRELYYFCLQYPEWKEELKHNTDTVGAVDNDGLPHGANISDQTGSLAARRADLARKCEAIEQAAIESDPIIYPYILQAVTSRGVTFHYLKTMSGIPCERDMYYDRRRKFYWILSKKI